MNEETRNKEARSVEKGNKKEGQKDVSIGRLEEM